MYKAKTKMVAACMSVVTIATMLSGCGGTQGGGDKTSIKLWIKPGQDAKDYDVTAFERASKDLQEKFPDVDFVFETMPQGGTDYRQEYDKALMAGTAPAIYTEFSYTDIPSRIDNGTVADITKYVDEWELKKEGKILDIFDEAISKDDKWYALPKKAYTQATLCSKSTIESAGGDMSNLPKTWDEFSEFGKKATDLSIPRLGYSLVGMDWCAWPFTAWVWSAGGEMVTPNGDGTYKISFNEDPGIDTAVYMNKMIWEDKMTQKDVLLGLEDIKNLIMNGTACFSWASFADLDTDKLKENGIEKSNFSVIPMPVKDSSIPAPALAGGEVITFNPKLSEDELKVAFDVADYLYFSDERMQVVCDEITEFDLNDVFVPGRVDWYEKKLKANTWLTDEQSEAMAKLSENAKPEPFCGHWGDLKTELVSPLQKIYLTEGITRDEVKALLDECADKLYELYPDTFKK